MGSNDEIKKRIEKSPQASSLGEPTPEWERDVREHQDRERGSGQAQSPVDTMHVDAPKNQKKSGGGAEH